MGIRTICMETAGLVYSRRSRARRRGLRLLFAVPPPRTAPVYCATEEIAVDERGFAVALPVTPADLIKGLSDEASRRLFAHRTERESAHEVLLQREGEDDDRQCAERRDGRDVAPKDVVTFHQHR